MDLRILVPAVFCIVFLALVWQALNAAQLLLLKLWFSE